MMGGRGPGPPPGPIGMLGRAYDDKITRQKVRPGTVRRIFPYSRPYRWLMALLLTLTAIGAATSIAGPLIMAATIDDGILRGRWGVVIWLSALTVSLSLVGAGFTYLANWASTRIGMGLTYQLRNEVYQHIQKQPLGFFTRSTTGSLISRLNSDVVGAQAALTGLLTSTLGTVVSLIFTLVAMFYLSWQVTVLGLAVSPLFIFPARLVGKRLQRFTRERMQRTAAMTSLMQERFNVSGAMLAKLYGRPEEEKSLFEARSGDLRDMSMVASVYGSAFGILMGTLTSFVAASAFCLGGYLVIHHEIKLGALIALSALLARLIGPIQSLSGLQVSVLTTLVSFDRLFEVLDLKPVVADRPGAEPLPRPQSSTELAPEIEFDLVSFRYPKASEVTLPSLEALTLVRPESPDDALVLHEVSFRAPGGKLTALVGPSGAGKTTITHLVPRLYDPGSGAVRIDGHDLREVTLQSVLDTVGVVTQDAHLFHDTIRANLLYGRPGASEEELVEACQAAQIWDLISSLPNGLDTVAGNRGYRLSGGEKQRIAIARLLLKAPRVVVLDEATAHLDSESEAAVQRALKTALLGRTSLVIAHRLSTIRDADQILVVNAGRIVERGTHEELLAAGGLYEQLYQTQFARQAKDGEPPGPGRAPAGRAIAGFSPA
jgi:ATP-binding cassette, subfamily B, bacterial